jgi:hypothetical protein
VDWGAVFSKLTAIGFDGWAVVDDSAGPRWDTADFARAEWPWVTGVHAPPATPGAQRAVKTLAGASAMVVFSASESQGVFYFEAWAADVPTFVYSGSGAFHSDRALRAECGGGGGLGRERSGCRCRA